MSSISSLIREAYIDPIRSVMVVDDEYPTLSKLLSGADESKPDDVERLRQVIQTCRQPENNWMIDVHDGNFEHEEGVENLHHSDLLILDYHLEGNADDGRGDKALKIISDLANKEHFNLVVVHTKGYSALADDEGYTSVFRDIVFNLQKHNVLRPIPPKFMQPIEEALNIWAESKPDIIELLLSTIDDLDFLSLISKYSNPMKIPEGVDELSDLKALYDSREFDVEDPEEKVLADLQLKCLVWYVFTKKSPTFAPFHGIEDSSGLEWGKAEGINWVKTDNLFVTVVGKRVPTSELPNKLLDALEKWNPHPHRLLLAKLRHQMDEKGFAIANSVVNKHYVQAGWLQQLLNSEGDKQLFESWHSVKNHIEELTHDVKGDLVDYLQRLVSCLLEGQTPDETLKSFTPENVFNDQNGIFVNINTFNNSMPIDGYHLVTGHILRSDSDNFHLVVTPACDLVPGRNDEKILYVTLQQLYDIRGAVIKEGESKLKDDEVLNRAREFVTSKKVIFVEINGDIRMFSTIVNLYGNASPKCMSVLIANDGCWDEGSKTLKVYESDTSVTPPGYNECKYIVEAQLRYEYALHNLNVAGEHMSRTGLGYQN